ncbi:LytR/AlgR family response regulator transcription factor [Gracilibacillus salinarum]|uniref:LytTR family DNA-binding domain-containing protein n=1 Tax=Gracilibacillus salinarum TaxID=2932255 RepID=A0ABY4GHS6_9BACI|nr:LytTR family DNA-binding domain-containing protein [Gracilibacillus salinarum]UOQ83745.1 LytTR family DNA-binding domain-containing protein [Gracilibacillus salinarum]
MKVIICENETEQRLLLESIISHYALVSEPSIEIVLSAATPEEVLVFQQDQRADCYFLDIELASTLNGMDVARKIREQDPFATIIFISMHADRLKLTFKYKLAALDFIVKDDNRAKLSEQVIDALEAAFTKCKQQNTSQEKISSLAIRIGEQIKYVHYTDIYYFETSPNVHKIGLHEKNGYYEFYAKLKDLEELHPSFFRCHKSYVINLQHIKTINKKERKLIMANDQECYLSFRKVKELQTKLNQQYPGISTIG